MRAVTYGPFPVGKMPDHAREFREIARAGFSSIRMFSLPERGLLDAAWEAGLLVFAGIDWRFHEDFLSKPGIVSGAIVRLGDWLARHSGHEALAGVYVGNEIPPDLVRWMGPGKVREVIEELIAQGKRSAPELLFAYANFPSTEYLEPANSDFTAFNIYLEERGRLGEYLRRLHNIAGDRPLVVSEFGMDSGRNSLERQAEVLKWGMESALAEECAGFTVFAWSDLWENDGREVMDWDFGLKTRDGLAKPAMEVCRKFRTKGLGQPAHSFSVIVCTRNGAAGIRRCLDGISKLRPGAEEVIVVDDGSEDGTSEIVRKRFPEVKLLRLPPSGLSAARNAGAALASGEILAFTDDDCVPDFEWLGRLDRAFIEEGVGAAGGPNLAPGPGSRAEAVVAAAPGAPSHVLVNDTRAEHLPGCNLAVRAVAFRKVGGFDADFHTAGDDVDFCWRLDQAGYGLAFVPGAFVWHSRRPSLRAFLKQQVGYGKAERMLAEKYPGKFSRNGEARWHGFVYGGGAVRAGADPVIYHGSMGSAGYQSLVNRMLPLRPIASGFQNARSEFDLGMLGILQPIVRCLAKGRMPGMSLTTKKRGEGDAPMEIRIESAEGETRLDHIGRFLAAGWEAGGATDGYDLEMDGSRILMATEQRGGGMTANLFRIWGDAGAALDLIRRHES